MTPTEPDEFPRIEVRIYENEGLVHTELFETLDIAEAFAEEWTERVPGARAEFEDVAHTHTLYEAVEDDTAVPEDHPRSTGEERP